MAGETVNIRWTLDYGNHLFSHKSLGAGVYRVTLEEG